MSVFRVLQNFRLHDPSGQLFVLFVEMWSACLNSLFGFVQNSTPFDVSRSQNSKKTQIEYWQKPPKVVESKYWDINMHSASLASLKNNVQIWNTPEWSVVMFTYNSWWILFRKVCLAAKNGQLTFLGNDCFVLLLVRLDPLLFGGLQFNRIVFSTVAVMEPQKHPHKRTSIFREQEHHKRDETRT